VLWTMLCQQRFQNGRPSYDRAGLYPPTRARSPGDRGYTVVEIRYTAIPKCNGNFLEQVQITILADRYRPNAILPCTEETG
jgi:hypothetical protein